MNFLVVNIADVGKSKQYAELPEGWEDEYSSLLENGEVEIIKFENGLFFGYDYVTNDWEMYEKD